MHKLKKVFFKLAVFYSETIKSRIIIDQGTKISSKAKLKTVNGGQIAIGKYCSIHDYVQILTYGGTIQLGDHCSVNPFCVLYGHGNLKIGNAVRIATSCVIIPSNHNFDDISKPIYLQGNSSQGIHIEDDVWIGAGTKILDGVTIGRGSVIGAGSVVTKNVAELTVAAGNPARFLRRRGDKKNKRI